jgi:hypothetical protein
LKAQYLSIKEEIDGAIAGVIEQLTLSGALQLKSLNQPLRLI